VISIFWPVYCYTFQVKIMGNQREESRQWSEGGGIWHSDIFGRVIL
jgi:hypothetical protein